LLKHPQAAGFPVIRLAFRRSAPPDAAGQDRRQSTGRLKTAIDVLDDARSRVNGSGRRAYRATVKR
jgi:hypothetical protein